MSEQKIPVSRSMVGVLTLVCFGIALVMWLRGVDEHTELWFAGFIRVGLLMSAFWVALPTGKREAAWANVSPATFIGLILAVLLLPRYPRFVIPALVVLAILGFVLRPRRRSRGGT